MVYDLVLQDCMSGLWSSTMLHVCLTLQTRCDAAWPAGLGQTAPALTRGVFALQRRRSAARSAGFGQFREGPDCVFHTRRGGAARRGQRALGSSVKTLMCFCA